MIEGRKFNNELNISVYISNKEPDYNNNWHYSLNHSGIFITLTNTKKTGA